MRHFSAQYVFTNSAAPLKRPVISTLDDGTIVEIEDTGGILTEKHSVEFYNGIIVPGFVNCHCHLELSHMKGQTAEGKGLGGFIAEVRNNRGNDPESIEKAIQYSDNELYNEGIVLCADICNTPSTFKIKEKSKIKYYNFLEVFGLDSTKAQKRIDEILIVADAAKKKNLPYSIVPHSAYSVSEQLFQLINNLSKKNDISSIHFLESESEREFLRSHTGPIMDSYTQFGILPADIHSAKDHIEVVFEKMASYRSLILVHNTFISRSELEILKKRENLFFCLCPASNLYIEKSLPPVEMIVNEGCKVVIGTDSKGSNERLSILNELLILQNNFPVLSIETLVKWATINGAEALGAASWAGSIEPGKKPGLLLIEDSDLEHQRLLKTSRVKRLI